MAKNGGWEKTWEPRNSRPQPRTAAPDNRARQCQSMGMTVKTSSVDQDEMFGIDRFWATEKSMSLRFERDRGGTPTATIFGRHTATKFAD